MSIDDICLGMVIYGHYLRSQISQIQRRNFLLPDHQMKRALKILSNQRIDHSLPIDLLVNIHAEGSLAHLPDLFPGLLVGDIIVHEGVDREDRSEEIQADLYFPFGHVGQQEVDPLLAQPVETLISCEGLFPLLEDLAAHVDQLDLLVVVGHEEAADSLGDEEDFSLGGALEVADVEEIAQGGVETEEFFDGVELLFVQVVEFLVFGGLFGFLLVLGVGTGVLLFLGGMGLASFLLSLLFHLLFVILGLDLFGLVLSLLLKLFLFSFFTLVLAIILQRNCIFHLRHMTPQQLLLSFHSLNLSLLSLVLPLEIFPLPEEGDKETATILIVGQDAHGVVKVHLLGCFWGGWEHGFFYSGIGIFLNFLE